jgi:hypothetical protein
LITGAALRLGNSSLQQLVRGYVETNGPLGWMPVFVERPLAMPLESEKSELALITFAAISKEISYGGLTKLCAGARLNIPEPFEILCG